MVGIDPKTGALTLDDGTTMGPSYERAEFLGSPHARRAREGVQNEPWSSWVVPDVSIAGRTFRMMVCFSDGRLGMIDLVLQGPEYGKSWESSPEKERARKGAHEAWLAERLGPPTTTTDLSSSWELEGCEVLSIFDKRACASAIHLRFGWEKDDPSEYEDD